MALSTRIAVTKEQLRMNVRPKIDFGYGLFSHAAETSGSWFWRAIPHKGEEIETSALNFVQKLANSTVAYEKCSSGYEYQQRSWI